MQRLNPASERVNTLLSHACAAGPLDFEFQSPPMSTKHNPQAKIDKAFCIGTPMLKAKL
jgi:hypothetical protein